MTKNSTADYCTFVAEAPLLAAIRTWKYSRISHLHTVAGDGGQDLYMFIVSIAICAPYADVMKRYQEGDAGLRLARRRCKQHVWSQLMGHPASFLVVHDQVMVQAPAAVESTDAHEKLEDCAEQPLHPST